MCVYLLTISYSPCIGATRNKSYEGLKQTIFMFRVYFYLGRGLFSIFGYVVRVFGGLLTPVPPTLCS